MHKSRPLTLNRVRAQWTGKNTKTAQRCGFSAIVYKQCINNKIRTLFAKVSYLLRGKGYEVFVVYHPVSGKIHYVNNDIHRSE